MMVKSGFFFKFTEPLHLPAKQPFWADIFAMGSSNSEEAR
jgi:hypothetical protein